MRTVVENKVHNFFVVRANFDPIVTSILRSAHVLHYKAYFRIDSVANCVSHYTVVTREAFARVVEPHTYDPLAGAMYARYRLLL